MTSTVRRAPAIMPGKKPIMMARAGKGLHWTLDGEVPIAAAFVDVGLTDSMEEVLVALAVELGEAVLDDDGLRFKIQLLFWHVAPAGQHVPPHDGRVSVVSVLCKGAVGFRVAFRLS